MLVLGIDPGTATTGYGLVRETEQGDLVLIEYGTILTPAGMEPGKTPADALRSLTKSFFSTIPFAGRWRSCFLGAT